MPVATHHPATGPTHRGKRFLINVFWNWLGVGAGLLSGFVVSPYMINKLGPEAYGVYALSFLLVDYYWFLDLGFRSATVKYVAHYWARDEFEKVQEVVNTGIAFSGAAAAFIFVAALFGARYVDRFFNVSPAYRESFFILVLLVSMSWCVNVVFSLYGACLEALQRFDYYNRIVVITTAIRASGTLLLLMRGYGLVQIGILVVSTQILGYMLHFIFFRKVFPEYRLNVRAATRCMFAQMGRYGIHNFIGNVSTQLLTQGPPILIGHLQSAAYVGYFQIPQRLLQYTGEAVGRIGIITNTNTAELVAKGERETLSQLAIYTNRYCLTIFMPLAIVLLSHGAPFFALWLPRAAAHATPLLPILLVAYVIAIVGQFSSSMLLMGMARYQWYSRGLLVEAVCSMVALWFVIPRYGLIGAAWVTAIGMVVNRGLFLPWLVSRAVHHGYAFLMNAIYTLPLLAAVPAYLLAMFLGGTILPGKRWSELVEVSLIIGAFYYTLAFVLCLPADHKALLKQWIGRKLSGLRYSEVG
ncbi:MAG: polysaccharide biosynthesis protein [Acidobacteriaceae bacterium]|nr:polysaccharide biosynthesis protein [Acidobacteriaceae bacterium]